MYSGTKWSKVGDIMFMGEYHHTIDEKGRITIPAKLREELGHDFIVTKGLDNCLFIYPKAEWQRIMEKYKNLPNTKNVRNFLRVFLSGAVSSELDKMGRCNINPSLIKFATLKKECVIVGVNERLEIWSLENWNRFMKDNEDNLSTIADELFENMVI